MAPCCARPNISRGVEIPLPHTFPKTYKPQARTEDLCIDHHMTEDRKKNSTVILPPTLASSIPQSYTKTVFRAALHLTLHLCFDNKTIRLQARA